MMNDDTITPYAEKLTRKLFLCYGIKASFEKAEGSEKQRIGKSLLRARSGLNRLIYKPPAGIPSGFFSALASDFKDISIWPSEVHPPTPAGPPPLEPISKFDLPPQPEPVVLRPVRIAFGKNEETELISGLWLVTAVPFYNVCPGDYFLPVELKHYTIQVFIGNEDHTCRRDGKVSKLKFSGTVTLAGCCEDVALRIASVICNGVQCKTEQSDQGEWGPVSFDTVVGADVCNLQFLVEIQRNPLRI